MKNIYFKCKTKFYCILMEIWIFVAEISENSKILNSLRE